MLVLCAERLSKDDDGVVVVGVQRVGVREVVGAPDGTELFVRPSFADEKWNSSGGHCTENSARLVRTLCRPAQRIAIQMKRAMQVNQLCGRCWCIGVTDVKR